MSKYEEIAADLGALVTSKQQQYGDSVTKSGKILEILYPEGVQPHQYTDALLVVRILDKLSRIAQRGPDGQDLGGESPYRDIAGYGLLGASKDGYVEPCASSLDDDGDFILPDWAYWKETGQDEMRLRMVGSEDVLSGAHGREGDLVNCWFVVAPGAPMTHGSVDDWDEAIDLIYEAINWHEWGKIAQAASKDRTPVVEAGKESYPMETIADKSPQWDGLYNEYRALGYRQVEAARMADEVCQTTAQ